MAGTNAPASFIGKTVIGKRVNRSTIGRSTIGRSTIGKSRIGRVITGGIPVLAVMVALMGVAIMGVAVMGQAHAQSTAVVEHGDDRQINITDNNTRDNGTFRLDRFSSAEAIYYIVGDNGTITNSATITLFTGSKDFLKLRGDRGTIRNTGSVRLTFNEYSNRGDVIDMDGDNGTIENAETGQIFATAYRSNGISYVGNNPNITNSGTITVDNGTLGIDVAVADSVINFGPRLLYKTSPERRWIGGVIRNTGNILVEESIDNDTSGLTATKTGGIRVLGTHARIENSGNARVQTSGLDLSNGLYLRDIDFNHTPDDGSPSEQRYVYSDYGVVINSDNARIFTKKRSGQGEKNIGINAYGSHVQVINQDNASISMLGEQSYGIFVSGDNAAVTNTGIARINNVGEKAHGIYVKGHRNERGKYRNAAGEYHAGQNAKIINKERATITTDGRQAYGIFVIGDNATVRNEGSAKIVTKGRYGIGIYGTGRDLNIVNSATIRTEGRSSAGIYIRNVRLNDTNDAGQPVTFDTPAPHNPTIMNSGTISTKGTRSWGIYARDFAGLAKIINTGSITTEGEQAAGIYLSSSDGDVAVTNSGTISTEGTRAYGLRSSGKNITFIMGNSSNITTAGARAPAIVVRSSRSANILNMGRITTQRDNASGIEIRGTGKDVVVNVTNSGTISTKGVNAYGIWVYGDNVTRVTITDSGNSILTSGAGAHGVRIASGKNIVIRGRIVTDGDNASGVTLQSSNNQTLQIAQGAHIQTNGGMAHAVKVEGTTGTTRIVLHGGLIATGAGAKLVEIVTPAGATTAAEAPDVTLAVGPGALIKGDLPSAVKMETLALSGILLDDGGTGRYNLNSTDAAMLRQVVGGVADMTHGALDDQLAKPGPTGSGSSGSGTSGRGDVWVEVADITQKQKAGKGAQAWKQDQRALYVGHDLQREGRDRYGLFFGIGNGGAATRDTGYSVKNDNLVLGAYGRHDRGAKGDGDGEDDGVSGQRLFWSAVLGQQSVKSTRHDSLQGKGSFKTSFVSLSAGAKRSFGLNNEVLKFERAQLRLGGRLGVTRGNIEAHIEKSGIGLDGLKIGKRDVNAVDLRAQAGLGRPFEGGDFEAYVGVAASRYSGGEYSASFGAGAAKQVKTPGAATRTNRFFGFRGHRMVNERVNLFAGAEFGEGKASHVSAKLGVKMKF